MQDDDIADRLVTSLTHQSRQVASAHWDAFRRLGLEADAKGIDAADAKSLMQCIQRRDERTVAILMEQAALKAIGRFLAVLDGRYPIEGISKKLHLFAGAMEISDGRLHERLKEQLRPIP